MTIEHYILTELATAYNENMKEAMRMKAMHCDAAADAYSWAATVIRGCVQNVFVEGKHYRMDMGSDDCPFGEFSYPIMEVL